MYLNNIIKHIKKRNSEDNNRADSTLAATLKRERLKLKLTLAELARGECSISYCSKLENNQIQPDNNIARRLFEKVDLDYDDFANANKIDYLSTCIKSYLYLKKDRVNKIYRKANFDIYYANNTLNGQIKHHSWCLCNPTCDKKLTNVMKNGSCHAYTNKADR